MHKSFVTIVAAVGLSLALGIAVVEAQGRGGGMGGGQGGGMSQGGGVRGLDRADQAAGVHGTQGRAIARTHGANANAFCPPGQRKKAGSGSRFQC